ncbi:DUF4351 domain-containing protein [Geitlerinema sp. PCC 9228]|uniref:DUF4351 domain-containing protein n=1 Tax=Geitlerinema sp. PCC 9228 TaxID=111611 RepID=UPI0008F9E23D|nr:DUF4351 domain-containing protein [Geitlerinema sp. PCC 9228]
MTKPADIGGKRLISLAPHTWAQWLTQMPNLHVESMLSSELPWVTRENDILLRVTSPETGTFLLLNELQLRYNGELPRRMRAYTGLVEEKYKLPVYPTLVNILPHAQNPQVPNCYESNFQGIRAYQEYRVINLWEVEVQTVFERQIRSLLPFVPVLRGGGEQTVVRQALQELRADEDLRDLEPLLSFFASFVLPVVQQIMRWDMAVLRESPWYQEILKEGLEQGLQQGLEQGLEQGRQEGRQEAEVQLVWRQLNRRLGNLDPSLEQQIRRLSVEQVETLAEALLDFSSVEDLQAWLQQQ